MKILEFIILALAIMLSIVQVYGWIDDFNSSAPAVSNLKAALDPGDIDLYDKVTLWLVVLIGILWSCYFTFF